MHLLLGRDGAKVRLTWAAGLFAPHVAFCDTFSTRGGVIGWIGMPETVGISLLSPETVDILRAAGFRVFLAGANVEIFESVRKRQRNLFENNFVDLFPERRSTRSVLSFPGVLGCACLCTCTCVFRLL